MITIIRPHSCTEKACTFNFTSQEYIGMLWIACSESENLLIVT